MATENKTMADPDSRSSQDASKENTIVDDTPTLEAKEHHSDENRSSNGHDASPKETIISWEGPSDPANPKNWSSRKKMINVGIVSAIGFLTPLSSSVSAPATPQIMAEFHNNSEVLSGFVVSIYVLGNAVGPILFAPASELWGRLILFHICNVLFVAFTLGCALSTSLPMLMVFRFLAGCVGAGPLAIGGGTIGDMIPVQERGKYTAVFAVGSLIGPIVGPIAGGYLTLNVDWRWSFWIVVIAGGLVTVLAFVFLRETHGATILKFKARRIQKQDPTAILKVEGAVTDTRKVLFARSFVRPMKMLFLSPVVFSLAIFQALSFGYMYLLFSTFPLIFSGQYGFNAGESGLAFLGFGIGCVIGLAVILRYSDKITLARAKKHPSGETRPESRLILMLYGALGMPIGLFWYGWAAQTKTHWIVPIIGTVVLALGIMAASLPGNLYMIDCFTIYAASALAATTFLRSILGGLIPLAGEPMYSRLGVGWGNSLLGFIALAFCVTPLAMIIFGERLRKRYPVKL